jgi:hypothetical protein
MPADFSTVCGFLATSVGLWGEIESIRLGHREHVVNSARDGEIYAPQGC